MNHFQSVTASIAANITVVSQVVLGRVGRRGGDRERGDVPGWVLITLMTAGLVTILWALAGAQLEILFMRAMNSVAGPGSQ